MIHISDKSEIKSKLENSESFNRVVLESSPDCLKILDIEGRLQFMNFNGLCQMEIDDFTVFKDQFWWDLWGRENEKLVKDSVKTALSGNATEFTAFCATAKGTPKWWHVTITPVASATEGIYQLLSVSRDITIQKKYEEELLSLNNLLEEKVKIRTEELLEKNIELERTNAELAIFNRIAGHDLQEPLRKIQLFCRRIVDEENGIDDSHIHFKRIISSTERMRNLIDSLLKFSISKNATITPEKCDLAEIINDVTAYSQDSIDEKKAVITVLDLPFIKGSKILLTQLFVNLLENALKYSKTDVAPQITISSKIIDSESLNLPLKNCSKQLHAVTFEDNGIGFSNEYKHQIFEIFKRLHTKDEFLGTGVGLAICKTIVEKHNGWLSADSVLGSGSVFRIYFQLEE